MKLHVEPSLGGAVALPKSGQVEFEGYATLFGEEDRMRDVVMPGAFKKGLFGRRLSRVPMLYQHKAEEPIGQWRRIEEDERGLFVRGRLFLSLPRAREVSVLMAAGALDGLSIGFRTVRARRDGMAARRLLLEVELWEISIVTFPMLERARVLRLRAAP